MNWDSVKRIADAVLYEGYLLYPYRASAVKNQQRFNFGVLVPRSSSDNQHRHEAWAMKTECLIEGADPRIEIRVRFLQLVAREVFKRAESQYVPVASLDIEGEVHHTWQEAVEREVVVDATSVSHLLKQPPNVEFLFGPNISVELLTNSSAQVAGKIQRQEHEIRGQLVIHAETIRAGLICLSVEIQNTTPVPANESTMLDSLVSTHTLLRVQSGQFVSLLDPPDDLAQAAAECQNVGTWPVLAGREGERELMLSSPIILYDYPQIAPESQGDYCDGLEIDEMLALRVMTLTEEEKHEMRHVDQRARQILERTESLPPERWQELHGAIRDLKPSQPNKPA